MRIPASVQTAAAPTSSSSHRAKPRPPPHSPGRTTQVSRGPLESDLASAATALAPSRSRYAAMVKSAAAAAATSPQRRKPAPPAPPRRRAIQSLVKRSRRSSRYSCGYFSAARRQQQSSVATSNRKSRDILNMFKKTVSACRGYVCR